MNIHCGVDKKVINGIKRLVVLCDDLLILDRKGLENERNYDIINIGCDNNGYYETTIFV